MSVTVLKQALKAEAEAEGRVEVILGAKADTYIYRGVDPGYSSQSEEEEKGDVGVGVEAGVGAAVGGGLEEGGELVEGEAGLEAATYTYTGVLPGDQEVPQLVEEEKKGGGFSSSSSIGGGGEDARVGVGLIIGTYI